MTDPIDATAGEDAAFIFDSITKAGELLNEEQTDAAVDVLNDAARRADEGGRNDTRDAIVKAADHIRDGDESEARDILFEVGFGVGLAAAELGTLS